MRVFADSFVVGEGERVPRTHRGCHVSRHSVGRCGAVEVFLVGRRRYLLLKTRRGLHNCGDRKHCWGYFCVGERKCFICREPIARVVRVLEEVGRSRLCLV